MSERDASLGSFRRMADLLHKDVVRNLWHEHVQKRVKVLAPDAPYEGNTSGSYMFTTDSHSAADCPFKDGDELPMRVFEVPEGEGLTIPADDDPRWRTDAWCWYCRRCGAEGVADEREQRDEFALAHIAPDQPCGSGRIQEHAEIGHIMHVWTHNVR